MKGMKSAFGAAMALVCVPATAQDGETANGSLPSRPGPEVGLGIFQHGANFHPLGSKLFFEASPPGVFYADSGEDGTVDVQLVYRSAPLPWLLKPRLTGKVQVSTAGRTSFASVGAEWRQHALRGRVYGQVGIGLTIHDGYRFTPDPFAPGIPIAEALRRYDITTTRIGFGSRVLFNPNASLGIRIDPKWAVEVTWEHFSHRQVFNEINPGLDNVGIRLIRTFGHRAR